MERRDREKDVSAWMFGGELSIYNSQSLSDGLGESVMDVLSVWWRLSVLKPWLSLVPLNLNLHCQMPFYDLWSCTVRISWSLFYAAEVLTYSTHRLMHTPPETETGLTRLKKIQLLPMNLVAKQLDSDITNKSTLSKTKTIFITGSHEDHKCVYALLILLMQYINYCMSADC